MTKQTATTVEIMGKSYQIKCFESEIESLQKAALFLEEEMRRARDVAHVLSIDRIAVISALNITHRFLNLENEYQRQQHEIQQRLRDLQTKIENAIVANAQMELASE